jgi:purine-nucleoside phosphorylase
LKTFHNKAEAGQIGKTLLMPGDPLLAKYIAETYLRTPFVTTRSETCMDIPVITKAAKCQCKAAE